MLIQESVGFLSSRHPRASCTYILFYFVLFHVVSCRVVLFYCFILFARGSLHQDHEMFSDESRGRQDILNILPSPEIHH